MSNSVLIVTTDILAKMAEHYKNSQTGQTPNGSVFMAKTAGCTITAYKSGKVLFQGKDAANEASKWNGVATKEQAAKSAASGRAAAKRNSEPTLATNENFGQSANVAERKYSNSTKATDTKYIPPENISSLSIIGSDEVGTGDYFGPMTVIAAYVSADKIQQLKGLGVKDSKQLTDSQIAVIAKEIIGLIPHSLLILKNEKYNELEKSGMNQGKMKAKLHNQAIHHVFNKLAANDHVDGVLIDQFCEPGVFFNYLKGTEISWKSNPTYFCTKAEGVHAAVAAASIIARYAFLQEFEKLSEKVGFELPKGAGAKVDQVAAELIRKHGEQALWQFAKVHFANTEKAKRLVR